MRVLPGLLLAAAVFAADAEKPRVRRAEIAAVERTFDQIESIGAEDSFPLLVNTQGVYVENFGVLFTIQVNLVEGVGVSPFRPKISSEQIAQLRSKKLARLPLLKKKMVRMLYNSAAALDAVPVTEQMVLAVSLHYFSWEDAADLPKQLVMRAERGKLLGRFSQDAVEIKDIN